MGVFSDAVMPYVQAGWSCIIPVPPDTKAPPPEGFTGADGRDTAPEDLIQFVSTLPHYSVALRMPADVIGIDVDHYDKGSVQKRGGDYLAELEAKLGPLPATWVSSARPAPSGIRFFRVPAGLRFRTKLGDSIEIIQRHHRYAVVAPSPHETTEPEAFGAPNGPYRWFQLDLNGERWEEDIPACPSELPDLPEAWVAYLQEGASEAGPAAAGASEGHALLSAIEADDREECAEVYAARLKAVDEMVRSDSGCRHDVTTERVHRLVMLGANGHPGVGPVLDGLRALWATQTAGEGREEEYERMLLTSARKAVTEVGQDQPVAADPCLMADAIPVAAPAPDLSTLELGVMAQVVANMAIREVADETPEPVRLWSVREAIGAGPFDPQAGLDLTLAAAVLERMAPALRYAEDAETWLRRGPELWETAGKDYAATVVAQVAQLMPSGSPEAEKGSDEANRAERRKRFMTSASASAVAKQMVALVRAPESGLRVRLAELDSEPFVMWAGGEAWDLRASTEYPEAADVDPGAPHLHSAAVSPAYGVATPLWDRFVGAVLPDEELREWALRVLAIGLTGYPDAALPILLGDPGAGKTSLIKLVMSVLGTYAHAADARLLADGNSHASIVYALKGRRLSFIDEGPRRGRWATERLKQLTGGGELTGNRMRENPITFDPTHTLVLTANDEPQLTDEGLRRRVRLIPCYGDPAEVRERRQALGPIGGTVWRREGPGILAGLMRHAGLWLTDPDSALTSAAPGSVRDLAEEIGKEQDTVRTWVESETEPHAEGTRAMALYEAFAEWCRRLQIRDVPSTTAWGRKLSALGYDAFKRNTMHRPLRLTYGGGLGQMPIADRPVTVAVTAPSPPRDQVVQTREGLGRVEGGLSANPPTLSPQVKHPVEIIQGGLGGFSPYNHQIIHNPPYTENLGEGGVLVQPSLNDLQTASFPQVNPPREGLGQPSHAGVSHIPGVSQAKSTLVFDLETHDAAELWRRSDFVRLAGDMDLESQHSRVYTDPAVLVDRIKTAGQIEGHNIFGFDLLALARHHGLDFDMAAAKAVDTLLLARLADPPMAREKGADRRYGLDEVGQRLFGLGKTDIQALKRKHGGWGGIPVDDPEFVEYLRRDLFVTGCVGQMLPMTEFAKREHKLAAIAGRMSLSGFRVDEPLLAERLQEGRNHSLECLAVLNERYDIPRDGRSPLSSKAGKAALAEAFVKAGAPDYPRTEKKKDVQTSRESMAEFAGRYGSNQTVQELCSLITQVTGERAVYGTVTKHLVDGRVHPTVSMGQASGRWSLSSPGLTVFGKRGGRVRERAIFLPDEGHSLIAIDLDQVDMRAIAGHSQDRAYMALFEPGRDVHAEIATQVFGSPDYRETAKPIGHGWNYGRSVKAIAEDGVPYELAKRFDDRMTEQFPRLIQWRQEVRDHASAGGLLDNGFGRMMRADPKRAWTQAPALMGQGGAHDLMTSGLLRLPTEIRPMLRAVVHDEVVLSVPTKDADEVGREVVKAMTCEWRGVKITAGVSKPGVNWAQVYAK